MNLGGVVQNQRGQKRVVRREKKLQQAATGQVGLLQTCRWQAVAKQAGRLDKVAGKCWALPRLVGEGLAGGGGDTHINYIYILLPSKDDVKLELSDVVEVNITFP